MRHISIYISSASHNANSTSRSHITLNFIACYQMNTLQPQRKNGLDNARLFQAANQINVDRAHRDLAASTAESMDTAEKVSSIMGRKR